MARCARFIFIPHPSSFILCMFDPTKPANNTPLSSAEMRAQLTALFDLTQAIPPGLFTGAPLQLPFGWNFRGIEIWDGLTTYNPGDALTYGGKLYVTLNTHEGVPPDTDPFYWLPVPVFFDFAGIATALFNAAQAASSNNTNAMAPLGLAA